MPQQFEIFTKSGSDVFAGGWEQQLLVKDGKCVAHFWRWDHAGVEHDWNPERDGFAGKELAKPPRGFKAMDRSTWKFEHELSVLQECLEFD